MPRVLSSELNTLKIQDNIGNCDIEIYYRTPTTKERVDYSNECIRRKRNKIDIRTAKARQKFGLKIIKGFKDGDFAIPSEGKNVPIASDSSSSNYRENWKELIAEYAMDIVETLAAYVFDTSTEIVDESDDTEEAEEETPDD